VDPTSFSEVGTYSVAVSYTDGNLESAYGTFNLEVTNTAPRFKDKIPDITVTEGSGTPTVDIASYIVDDEGNDISISITETYNGATT
jgi:hypothetical protein